MTPSELKNRVGCSRHDGHFFSRGNMRFAGDTMRNYGVRSATISALGQTIVGGRYQPETVEVWELYRKRPVKHGLSSSAYFDKQTFTQRFPVRE